MNRKVKTLLPAVEIDMGGLTVKQAFPTLSIEQIDPFLLLHHGKFSTTELAPAIQQGIGPHPHRGFSPVTFVIEGEVQHRDSRGNKQIAKAGEVQWMHAGAGIIHSERPSQHLVERNGVQEMVQLWINSPESRKMQEPKYQFLSEADIPIFTSKDQQIRNKLVAGKSNGLTGKIVSETELLIIWGQSTEAGTQTLDVFKGYNTTLYLVHGEVRISGYGKVEAEHLVVFENNSESIEMSTAPNTCFLLLAGLPIHENVVQQGPYVMNTETQILEAIRDYRMGKMGYLVED